MITPGMSMCQAVLENQKLLLLFPRFNFQMGFGEMSVEEVCKQYNVNTDFFLEIANSYLDEAYVPAKDLSFVSLGTIVEYLTSTHSYFIDIALPGVENKIYRLLDHSELSHKEVQLVTGFFNDYKQEFLAHISEEEKEILPYILELESQSAKEVPDPEFLDKLSTYSISEFAQEHDRLEYSLENLSKLIVKYLPPFEDFELCIQVLGDLSDLVRDLVDHANMEDKVLIPRVSELEKQIIRRHEIT
ncbi:MAG: hemerythrin domain-containing protein [Bacteroidales bacterium]|nr:hemerythrin domain-containing protein [Bacteroidales bacterium]